ncbi:DNA adenine methylase [Halomonas sp. TD01]|uniref:DNA adenine methylase n=1 Tax=Halomonas sp. TD01 TaxID=999141 RepID=UPI00391AEDAF
MRPSPAEVEVLNDVNGDLVNLYRIVQNHLEEFVRQFKWALSSRQVFEWLKMTRPETLTDIQRAARFYYLQQNAFGARIEGQTFGTATTTPPGLNLLRLEEPLSAAHLRLASTFIEHLSWQACIERYDRPDIRRIFADYHIETTDIRYTVGGGKGSDAKEVLIFSWDVDAEPAGLF